jgi:hypothetical protein
VSDSSHHSWPSDRAALLIGKFADFVRALDDGALALAARHQEGLRRLGVNITVRPLGEPLDQDPPRRRRPRSQISLAGAESTGH